MKEMIKETIEARVEFHERYWSKISDEAKIFIKLLLNPDPARRPTATEAYNNHWLTGHEASTEHDVAFGLREHFDPRKRWRSVIASARAMHRFGKHSRASSASSAGSGGWGGDHIHSETEFISSEAPSQDGSPSDASESFTKLSLADTDPGTNDHVKVIGPEDATGEQGKEGGSLSASDALTGGSEACLKDAADEDSSNAQASGQAETSSSQLAESETKRSVSDPTKDLSVDPVGSSHPERAETPRSVESDLSELRMPGTFHISKSETEGSQRAPIRWSETFRKFGLFI